MLSTSQPRAKSTDTYPDPDSRTLAVGRKRSATASQLPRNLQACPTKRRKRSSKSRQEPDLPVGAESLGDFVPFSSLQNSDFASGRSGMDGSSFGKNRLKTGFLSSNRNRRSVSHPGTPEDSDTSASLQPSADQQTIHDLDTTDEEGGITLNVQDNETEPIVISDEEGEDEESQEEGELLDSHEDEYQTEREEKDAGNTTANSDRMHVDTTDTTDAVNEDNISFIIDTTPSKPHVCLKDLNPEQLEQQIKYAFWHLRRDEIDLGRPARCLHCQVEGHIDSNCPDKTCAHCGSFGGHETVTCPEVRRCDTCRQPGHKTCTGMKNTTIPCDLCSTSGHAESDCVLRFYPRTQLPSSGKMDLWIYCCSCASKSHLVGDCPQIRSSKAARWSLKHLDPNQIVNLSIQKGVERLEKAAQNRGSRPEGLQIRGRADRRYAGTARSDSSDSDDLEHFFSHAPAPRKDKRRPPPGRSAKYPPSDASDTYRPRAESRYDRFTASSGPDSYRPPRNAFYETDSFGKPRSRSPIRLGRHFVRRSPSPGRSRDMYQLPSRPESRRSSPPPQRPNFPRRPPPTAPKPASGVSIQLPTRKGSNPNLTAGTSTALGNLPPKPAAPANKSEWSAYQRRHNGLTKTEHRKIKQNKKTTGQNTKDAG